MIFRTKPGSTAPPKPAHYPSSAHLTSLQQQPATATNLTSPNHPNMNSSLLSTASSISSSHLTSANPNLNSSTSHLTSPHHPVSPPGSNLQTSPSTRPPPYIPPPSAPGQVVGEGYIFCNLSSLARNCPLGEPKQRRENRKQRINC